MADEAKLAEIERQLARMDESSVELRRSIEGLTVPLDALAVIQQEQRDIKLAAESAASKADAVEVRAATRARQVRRALVAGAVVLVLLAGSLAGSYYLIVQQGRKLCPMVSILIPKPGDPPPRDERAARIRSDAAQTWRDLHCNS